MTALQPAHLVSVPELAELRAVPYRTLYRDLLILWQRDVAEGGGDWLLRGGRHRKLWVNLSRLKVAHPVLFDRAHVGKDDFEAMSAKLEALAFRVKQLEKRCGAMGARLRELGGSAKAPACCASECHGSIGAPTR